MQTESSSGKKYMVTFVDDYSRSCATFYMAHKSDTFAMFKQFHEKVTGETGERIGVLKTDGGGKYRSKEFVQYTKLSMKWRYQTHQRWMGWQNVWIELSLRKQSACVHMQGYHVLSRLKPLVQRRTCTTDSPTRLSRGKVPMKSSTTANQILAIWGYLGVSLMPWCLPLREGTLTTVVRNLWQGVNLLAQGDYFSVRCSYYFFQFYYFLVK